MLQQKEEKNKAALYAALRKKANVKYEEKTKVYRVRETLRDGDYCGRSFTQSGFHVCHSCQ